MAGYANKPLSILSTEYAKTGKSDEFVMDASHMTLVHNVMIRCYNAIYLQAPKIKAKDVPDFLHFCDAWHETVLGHHHSEEAVLFPMIEEATGVKGIMDGDVEEHKAFYGGLGELKNYLDKCLASPTEFDGSQLVKLLDAFGPALKAHLEHEPPKLASLAEYKIDMAKISAATADHSMKRTSTTDVMPILWFNLDVDFEDGKWKDFPEVPWPIKWFMINVLGWWRSPWWRFASCGADGKQRQLYALRDDY